MELDIAVGDPFLVMPRVWSVMATVRDADPRIEAEFGYVVRDRTAHMVSFCVRPRGADPHDMAVLTVAEIRDLPLARWNAAAQVHVLDRIRVAAGEATDGLASVVDYLVGAGKIVDTLYPGLRTSTKPADVRRYRGLRHLAEIATEFQFEQRRGTPDPAAAIARSRDAKPTTVRSWVHRARKAGFLPELESKGEQQ